MDSFIDVPLPCVSLRCFYRLLSFLIGIIDIGLNFRL